METDPVAVEQAGKNIVERNTYLRDVIDRIPPRLHRFPELIRSTLAEWFHVPNNKNSNNRWTILRSVWQECNTKSNWRRIV